MHIWPSFSFYVRFDAGAFFQKKKCKLPQELYGGKKKSETKSQHNRPKHSIRVNPLITPSVGRESVGFM